MTSEKKSRLIPLTKWPHPWPSRGGLRHIVSNLKEKKCTHVFIKVSGRWLIDEDAFYEWAHSYEGK